MPFHPSSIGKSLPRCPSSWHWANYISYPSVSLIFIVLALTSFIFATIIGFKYNSVRVFNRKIRTQNISNTMWILYFCALGFRGISNTVRFSLEESREESLDSIFFLASLILHGITAFTLSLALNHQRKYRSSIPSPSNQPKEADPLLAKYAWCRRTITGTETLFFFMFVMYLIFLYLQIMKSGEKTYEILFLCAFAIQRIPVIVLVLLICFGRSGLSLSNASSDGPTRRSKIYLSIAAVFNTAGDLPLTIWNSVLPSECTFYVASWVDVIHALCVISLLFFFLFLRSEYLRNMEECIWTTVSQIQDTFDFRRF